MKINPFSNKLINEALESKIKTNHKYRPKTSSIEGSGYHLERNFSLKTNLSERDKVNSSSGSNLKNQDDSCFT